MKTLLIICLVFLIGCNGKPKCPAKGNETIFLSYSSIPSFIKKYLDSIDQGEFLIAEHGEEWNAGCLQEDGVPGREFLKARLNKNYFYLSCKEGGIGLHETTFTLHLKDNKILSHSITAGQITP